MTNINQENCESPFQVGGTMDPDSSTYVEREADIIIERVLTNRQYAYVFNTRQIGKSSLFRRVEKKLILNGWKTAYISLTKIGVNNMTETRWYCDIIKKIVGDLHVKFDVNTWWNPTPKEEEDSIIFQLDKFIREILWSLLPLEDQEKNILITFDEIDTVLSLKFSTDDFFALIREFYNDRHHTPQLNRLAFCFLGVADHEDLMTDINRTPFNNAQPIELKGFTLEEAQQGLFQELVNLVEEPEKILKEIIDQTRGQPYLTQFLCDKIFWGKNRTPEIKQLIRNYLIKNWSYNSHFARIVTRLNKYDKTKANLLKIYQRIRQEKRVLANEIREKERIYLRLSGLVVETEIDRQTYVEIYNPIYREIFDNTWLDSQFKERRPQWYEWRKTAWEKSGDEFYFLCDEQLRIAKENNYHRILTDDDQKFIEESELEYRSDIRDISIFDKKETREKIIDRLIYWTNRQETLLKALKDIVNNAQVDDEKNIDERWMDDLVEISLFDHELKNNNLTAIIDGIKQRIEKIKQESERQLFDLLVTYGKILLSSQSQSEESKKTFKYVEGDREQELLLSSDIGLISKRWNKDFTGYDLEVSNPIYQKMFNLDYIEQILPNIRGYGIKLAKWLIFQQNEYLLQNQELEDIVKELADQNLVLDEHKFLIRSRILN